MLMAQKFGMGFLGLNFGPGTFLGFDFCPHSIIPVAWIPEYSPLPPWDMIQAEPLFVLT